MVNVLVTESGLHVGSFASSMFRAYNHAMGKPADQCDVPPSDDEAMYWLALGEKAMTGLLREGAQFADIAQQASVILRRHWDQMSTHERLALQASLRHAAWLLDGHEGEEPCEMEKSWDAWTAARLQLLPKETL